VLGLVVPWISTDKQLGELLMLNHQSSRMLKQTVHKHALLTCQPERLPLKRQKLWDLVMGLSLQEMDYQATKKKVEENPILIENVEEVIQLDV